MQSDIYLKNINAMITNLPKLFNNFILLIKYRTTCKNLFVIESVEGGEKKKKNNKFHL